MQPVRQIRRSNLRTLVGEAGSQSAVAAKLEKDKNQIWQWLIEDESLPQARAISDRTARLLEQAFHRPDGWMDSPHDAVRDPGATYGRESHVAGFDLAILGQAMQLLELVLGITGDPPELIKDAWCIQQAYFTVAREMRSDEMTEEELVTKLAAPLASRLRERKPGNVADVSRGTEEPGAENGGRDQHRAGRKN